VAFSITIILTYYFVVDSVLLRTVYREDFLAAPRSNTSELASKHPDDNPKSAVLVMDLWIGEGARF